MHTERTPAQKVSRLLCCIIAGLLFASPFPLIAQARTPVGLLNVHGEFQVTHPQGEFARYTGTGYGLGGGILLRIDPAAILNWRIDMGIVTYGSSTRRIPLAGTGGLIQLELNTTSSIFSLVTGPQLLGPTGTIMPYVAPLGGFSVFWTTSSVEGSSNQDQPFASTVNASDLVMTYGGAAGVYIRVREGNNPIRLDLGARVLRHDNARYLNGDRVREAFESQKPAVPIRGRADFLIYHAGVSVVTF